MRAFPKLLAACLSGGLILSGALSLRAQSNVDAPLYLRQAILQFQQGRADLAQSHLSAARGLDRDRINRDPDARKLAGLLLLVNGRDREAMPEILSYLKSRPTAPGSAFLWYLLGNYNLKYRSYNRAARAYAQAANAARAGPANPSSSIAVAWPALAPITCPAAVDDSQAAEFWIANEQQNPLRIPDQYASLWNRPLTGEETALAAFAARLYSKQGSGKTNKNTTIEETSGTMNAALDNTLARALAQAGVTDRLGAPLAALLKDPGDATNHQTCLQQLESLERAQLALIARGAMTPARERLKQTRVYLTRMHFARMVLLRDQNSMYRYSSYLLRRGNTLQGRPRQIRAIQALHASRQAIAASGSGETKTKPTDPGIQIRYDDGKQLRVQVQILHQIALAYALLGRDVDHGTLTTIAFLLADHADQLTTTGVRATDRETNELQRTILKRCGENLNNREALLILLDATGQTNESNQTASAFRNQPPRPAAYYRRKLAERDQKYDEAELLSAFAP